jgi:hypothetical protein
VTLELVVNLQVGVSAGHAAELSLASRCEDKVRPFKTKIACVLFVIRRCKFIYPPNLFEPAVQNLEEDVFRSKFWN